MHNENKSYPRTGYKGPEGSLSLTLVQDGVGGQHHAPAALPSRKDPEPIV